MTILDTEAGIGWKVAQTKYKKAEPHLFYYQIIPEEIMETNYVRVGNNTCLETGGEMITIWP